MTASLALTPAGGLKNLADWNESVAEALAARDNLRLTAAHWEILRLMRAYYDNFRIAPIRKLLKQEIREQLGADKAGEGYLAALFPGDVLHQGTKVAGLPWPMLDAEIEQEFGSSRGSGQLPASDAESVRDIPFQGRTYQVTGKGNLVNQDDWSEALAVFLAEQDGIALTPEHWEVIRFLRTFYFKYGIVPMVRLLMKHMRMELGADKGSETYLYKLFPGGPSRQGSRIAGLPEPQGCID